VELQRRVEPNKRMQELLGLMAHRPEGWQRSVEQIVKAEQECRSRSDLSSNSRRRRGS